MTDFEKIDDYLANRLQETDRTEFEQAMDGNPGLKEEVSFQQQLVEGVRRARVAELKSMLNNVPVGGSAWTGGKIAASVVSVGIVVTSLFLYLNNDSPVTVTTTALQEEVGNVPKDNSQESALTAVDEKVVKTDSSHMQSPIEKKTLVVKEKKISKPVQKPDLQVIDPSLELTSTEEINANTATPSRAEISPSKMEVITGVADKKHTFHYQFVQGKLMLFGPFDKSLYEILEIHGDVPAVFLFYKENYYLLDVSQTSITALRSIQDGQLLKKLKAYRNP